MPSYKCFNHKLYVRKDNSSSRLLMWLQFSKDYVNSGSAKNESRRDFFKLTGALSLGLLAPPAIANNVVSGDAYHQQEIEKNIAIQNGKAQRFTILHTSDIHAQLYTHDEFFLENNKPVYKKRGGFAVLKTMLNKLRAENPANTILIDGGDCFQGGGVAALTQGKRNCFADKYHWLRSYFTRELGSSVWQRNDAA